VLSAISCQLSELIKMKDYNDLNVWLKAHQLVLKTSAYPKIEQYRLANQLIRAVSSISTNIAEGCGRGSDKDFARFFKCL
jgi:four helix bundle protein